MNFIATSNVGCQDINIKINKLTNIKYDQRLSSSHSLEYTITTDKPIFDNPKDNNKLNELLSFRSIKFVC